MAMPTRNPYAPPAAAGAVGAEPGPLPPGARRYPIDPVRHRAAVRAQLLRVFGWFSLFVVLLGYALARSAPAGSFGVWLLFVALITAILAVRMRRMTRRAFATYDLLVGPRTIRRTVAGLPPAEILRPEVSRAFETRWGLWLECDSPRCTLYVSGALVDYEPLRATLGEWARIERVRGWTAWRRARGAAWRQGPRDVVAGTALAADESLAQELETLRRASSTAWMAHPQIARPGKRWRRMLIVWALLIVLFLALWQFLQPSPRVERPARGVRPGTLGP